MAAVDQTTFTKATADAVVTLFLGLTLAEAQYAISRLKLEYPIAFRIGKQPDGVDKLGTHT